MHIEIQNCFSFWRTSSPGPLPGLRPWTPLGDFCPQTPAQDIPHILYQVYAPGFYDCETLGILLLLAGLGR